MGMKKKVMAAGLAACMGATLIGGATLAYFTDKDNRTNTFTAAGADGSALDITLHETADGRTVDGVTLHEATSGQADTGFSYENVLPGLAYDKHVTIDLENDSVDSHLYVQLSISNYSYLQALVNSAEIDETALQDAFLVNPNASIRQDNVVATKMEDNTFSMVFDFGKITDPEGDAKYTAEVFDGVKLPANLTSDDLAELKGNSVNLTINAYAIQENTGDTDVLDAAKAEWATEWFGA